MPLCRDAVSYSNYVLSFDNFLACKAWILPPLSLQTVRTNRYSTVPKYIRGHTPDLQAVAEPQSKET